MSILTATGLFFTELTGNLRCGYRTHGEPALWREFLIVVRSLRSEHFSPFKNVRRLSANFELSFFLNCNYDFNVVVYHSINYILVLENPEFLFVT
jgi:hypothetical protein